MVQTIRPILKTSGSIKPPMNIIIFLPRSEYNFETYQYCKNKTKTALLSQYSMVFTGKHDEVVYIIFYIKLLIGKDIDRGQYVCDELYYNTRTCLNCNDDTITNYSGYTENVYDNLSNENKQKTGGNYHG